MSDLTDRFENGETRYFQDLNFKQAIDCLSTGVGVYAVLDGTLKKLARAEAASANTAEALRLALHEKAELTEALEKLEKENKELWNSELWKENRALKAKLEGDQIKTPERLIHGSWIYSDEAEGPKTESDKVE